MGKPMCTAAGAGPLFTLCWPLYNLDKSSRFLAASVPLTASIVFVLVGKAAVPDFLSLVPAATRNGGRQELLKGPFSYGIMHSLVAMIAWQHPAGVMAVSTLCGGDGLAELVGSSVPSPRLPWNRDKSVAGSVACLFGGWAMGFLLIKYFAASSTLLVESAAWLRWQSNLTHRLAVCSLLGAAAESVPLPGEGVDNVVVPISTLAIAYFL